MNMQSRVPLDFFIFFVISLNAFRRCAVSQRPFKRFYTLLKKNVGQVEIISIQSKRTCVFLNPDESLELQNGHHVLTNISSVEFTLSKG